jgi:hypothetical protein
VIEDKDKDHISLETEVEIERKMGDRHDISEGKGKGPETPYDSTQTMLNDLAMGQRDRMNIVTQMAINT